MNIKTFLLTPSNEAKTSLRRYSRGTPCTGEFSYHNAETEIGVVPYSPPAAEVEFPHDDPRWPTHCSCGYAFQESDEWQHREAQLYTRSDGGEPTTLREAPVGALWFASWMSGGLDERGPLIARLPHKHDWNIDSRASNCDSPCRHCGVPYRSHQPQNCSNPGDGVRAYTKGSYEDARPHKCWVRHGEPPNIHVDKNGVTCGAGAGSIQTREYHGFLHNGELTDCP